MTLSSLRRAALLVGVLCATNLSAIQLPTAPAAGAPATIRSEQLYISQLGQPADRLQSRFGERASRLGGRSSHAMIDERSGRFLTLMLAKPMLPGTGVGNRVVDAQATASPVALQQRAAQVFGEWLQRHQEDLRIDPAELGEPHVSLISPDHIQIYIPRQVGGVPVREAAITATIKHGNLILVGLSQWADLHATRAQLNIDAAREILAQRIAPLTSSAEWKSAELAYLPVATGSGGDIDSTAPGLAYRLVHVLHPAFADPHSRHEALIDALTGELLLLTDTVHHLATPREIKGGVYPVSNDGVPPDGAEQLGWPMPYTAVTTPAGVVTTDLGGNLPICVDGSITASLRGPYVNINDNCGASSLSGSGNLDFGGSGGTDCTTPGIGGAGNTHSARTGFHELNMIMEMARGQLPFNAWLQRTLTANMNINNTCNAIWNGTVNFYRSGGGCANTGEIAGVFDHEWGHGMDNNDGVPSVSSPGEGIADVYASLRLDDSCIGRNFRSIQCTGELPGGAYACTQCTGVRDIDWNKHLTNAPFTLAHADSCAVATTNGPCGGSVHCEGQVYSQAIWDLWNRDLVGGSFNRNKDVAREIATRLTFAGASGVQTWFACNNGTGGCNNAAGCGCAATSGYQQYLAADDDNGNLMDGTPHMSAIHAAFSRHGIACNTPTVTDSGCSDSPTELPLVTATPGNGSVNLSWTASAGASSYRVYRTDGVFGCDFGKILIGTVSGTSFVDVGLQNDRQYHYIVIPTGANSACFGVSSSCTAATPTAGPRLGAIAAQVQFTAADGDEDIFVDNCETTTVSVPVNNIGSAGLSNVRIIAASSPSHPQTLILSPLPLLVSADLASCGSANTDLQIRPQGLEQGDELVLGLTLVSDEQPGQPLQVTLRTLATESDLSAAATQSFDFEADENGWSVVQGTFQRSNASGGGVGGSGFYLRSSTLANNQCDAVDSPLLVLSADSTLSLHTRYGIENVSGGTWYDRAQFGVFTPDNGAVTVLSPSGGRTYNASGNASFCGFGNTPGWANTADSWAESSFNATALQSATLADRPLHLRMRYGTDSSVNGFGLRFDNVSVTNARRLIPDQQSNQCVLLPLLSDGFESPQP